MTMDYVGQVMIPRNERQFLALSSRIKPRVSGFVSPSVLDMTSLANLAEANITVLTRTDRNVIECCVCAGY